MSGSDSLQITLDWIDALHFKSRIESRFSELDGNQKDAFSPVESLVASLAGCMAIDVITILNKMRLDVKELRLEADADRNSMNPRYVKSINLKFYLKGELAPDRVRRAIDLSQEKYCSVFHSLRPDLQFGYRVQIDD